MYDYNERRRLEVLNRKPISYYIEEGARAKRLEMGEVHNPYSLAQFYEYHAWLAGFRDEKKPS